MAAKVLILVDVDNWAWARKARELEKYLSDEFEITIWVKQKQGHPPEGFDLYHTFEFPQVDLIPYGARILTGITAHVWTTWGKAKVYKWAARSVGLHANSLKLEREIKKFHRRIYYVPNGVCPDTFQRTRPRKESGKLLVGHVGKPNGRKGAHIIRSACEKAGVDLKINQRKYDKALTTEQMIEWYQDCHVIAIASDMDGTPNPALEGAACEVAILTNPIGNMPEFMKSGYNGFMIPRSVGSMAERLYWMRKHRDETKELGKNARATVLEGWTWKRQAENYRAMWREALDAPLG